MPGPWQHALEMEVRDYECDLQGVVNNANYQHYLEHARHVFLKSLGIDFAAFAARGINLVVARIEIDYKFPLKAATALSCAAGWSASRRSASAFFRISSGFRTRSRWPWARSSAPPSTNAAARSSRRNSKR